MYDANRALGCLAPPPRDRRALASIVSGPVGGQSQYLRSESWTHSKLRSPQHRLLSTGQNHKVVKILSFLSY
jgi:hypothetical protein